jgi:hypothetical protein
MRMRWSLILPIAGLILFAAVSYRSMDVNHHEEGAPTKYYWWSSLRLDSEPLNKNPKLASPCQDKKENCVQWELSYQWVQPGLLDKLLVVSALPAFLVGAATVIGLSNLGIDEVLTFMVSMPILIFAWYYLVGWLIDRWSHKRKQAKRVRFKLT